MRESWQLWGTDEVNLFARHPIVLVLSPLKSLMKDQVTGLLSKMLSAAIIVEEQALKAILVSSKNAILSCIRSPEAIVGLNEWMKAFQSDVFRRNIAVIAVDEDRFGDLVITRGPDFRVEGIVVVR